MDSNNTRDVMKLSLIFSPVLYEFMYRFYYINMFIYDFNAVIKISFHLVIKHIFALYILCATYKQILLILYIKSTI